MLPEQLPDLHDAPDELLLTRPEMAAFMRTTTNRLAALPARHLPPLAATRAASAGRALTFAAGQQPGSAGRGGDRFARKYGGRSPLHEGRR